MKKKGNKFNRMGIKYVPSNYKEISKVNTSRNLQQLAESLGELQDLCNKMAESMDNTLEIENKMQEQIDNLVQAQSITTKISRSYDTRLRELQEQIDCLRSEVYRGIRV